MRQALSAGSTGSSHLYLHGRVTTTTFIASIVDISSFASINGLTFSFLIVVALKLSESGDIAIGGGRYLRLLWCICPFLRELIVELVDMLPSDNSYLMRQHLKLAPMHEIGIRGLINPL
jgi:hypothetical protein